MRLTSDGRQIFDARIPAIGGELGQNCLLGDGLSYDVLTDLTEHGLVHSDYDSYQPYGPRGRPFDPLQPHRHLQQVPFDHQGSTWVLIPEESRNQAKPIRVTGAKLTSSGTELLEIVDIEPLPEFTERLVNHFSQSGYKMMRTHSRKR